MIITIVGGGSTFTPGIVKSIALRKEELEVDEIRLFDVDKERQDKLGVLVKWILDEDLKCGIKLTVTYDEKEAYTDADFIFAQMRVGKYAMREQDEKIPLRHGCVGQETCGCGGMAYGMRTIFPMIKVIDDVEKYAKPTYWILNYSNPASIVSEACRRLRPNARIINICDMPIAIIDVVAAALEVDKKDLVYDYYGLNHFGWFTSIEYKGEDVMPKLRDYIMDQQILLPAAYLKDKKALTSSGSGGNRHTKGSWYYVWKGVYEIMQNFPETLPNTYLNYYLQQKEFVEHSDPDHTRANEVMETREKNLFDGIDRYLATGEIDESVFYAGSHGDWIADLAIALKNDTKARFQGPFPGNHREPGCDPEHALRRHGGGSCLYRQEGPGGYRPERDSSFPAGTDDAAAEQREAAGRGLHRGLLREGAGSLHSEQDCAQHEGG